MYDIGYDDISLDTPVSGNLYNLRITKAEAEVIKTKNGPREIISLEGNFEDENLEHFGWRGKLWLPDPDDDDKKRFKQNIGRFFRLLISMNVPEPRGKEPNWFAEQLEGRVIYGKVKDSGYATWDVDYFTELLEKDRELNQATAPRPQAPKGRPSRPVRASKGPVATGKPSRPARTPRPARGSKPKRDPSGARTYGG